MPTENVNESFASNFMLFTFGFQSQNYCFFIFFSTFFICRRLVLFSKSVACRAACPKYAKQAKLTFYFMIDSGRAVYSILSHLASLSITLRKVKKKYIHILQFERKWSTAGSSACMPWRRATHWIYVLRRKRAPPITFHTIVRFGSIRSRAFASLNMLICKQFKWLIGNDCAHMARRAHKRHFTLHVTFPPHFISNESFWLLCRCHCIAARPHRHRLGHSERGKMTAIMQFTWSHIIIVIMRQSLSSVAATKARKMVARRWNWCFQQNKYSKKMIK